MEPNFNPTQPDQPQQPVEPAQAPQPQPQFTPQNQMDPGVMQPTQPTVGQFIPPGQAIVSPQVGDVSSNATSGSTGSMANKKLMLIVGVAVVLLALGGVGAFIMTREESSDTTNKESSQVDSASTESSSLDPSTVNARNTQRRTDVNTMHSKLEEFFNVNGFYPSSIETDTLAGLNPESLKDQDNNMIVSTSSSSFTKPANPYESGTTVQSDYSYMPYSCSSVGSSEQCVKYVYTRLDNDPEGYTKDSLN